MRTSTLRVAAVFRAATLCLWTLSACALMSPAAYAAGSKKPSFSQSVDEYLEQFARFHPSIAAGNGLHQHDGLLEDFSAPKIRAEVAWLNYWHHRFDSIKPKSLTADERVDRRIVLGVIEGWLLDLNTIKTWRRNPMIYVSAISDGLHNLMTMDSSPSESRMREAIAKLQGVSVLLNSARVNIAYPPRVYVEHAIEMTDGLHDLLTHDLALAFATSSNTTLQKQLSQAAAKADKAVMAYRTELTTQVLPHAVGLYMMGTNNVLARYKAEELIDMTADQLLNLGTRELAVQQAAFAEAAARIDAKRNPLEIWHEVQNAHPKTGELVPAARVLVDELLTFIKDRHLVDLPANENIIVAPAPAYDLGLASMHSSPPLEPKPIQSYYYLTDADPSWPAARQDEWLKAFNYATLADITAHEVAPGHYVHSVFMRHTPGKIRRIWVGLNPFPQPSSGQDGWAHYAEQLVSDEGFKADDPRYKMAQIAEALNRICRLIVGLRLHSGQWTITQASDFFVTQAYLPKAQAQREAERGTYDPTYGGYFLGKMAALKLRHDYEAAHSKDFSLAEFHQKVMTNGIAPWWAHRQLLLPGDKGTVLQ